MGQPEHQAGPGQQQPAPAAHPGGRLRPFGAPGGADLEGHHQHRVDDDRAGHHDARGLGLPDDPQRHADLQHRELQAQHGVEARHQQEGPVAQRRVAAAGPPASTGLRPARHRDAGVEHGGDREGRRVEHDRRQVRGAGVDLEGDGGQRGAQAEPHVGDDPQVGAPRHPAVRREDFGVQRVAHGGRAPVGGGHHAGQRDERGVAVHQRVRRRAGPLDGDQQDEHPPDAPAVGGAAGRDARDDAAEPGGGEAEAQLGGGEAEHPGEEQHRDGEREPVSDAVDEGEPGQPADHRIGVQQPGRATGGRHGGVLRSRRADG